MPNLTELAAIIVAIASLYGAIMQYRTKKTVDLINVEKKNEVQDGRLSKVEAELAALGHAIPKLLSHFEREEFIRSFKQKIRARANLFVEQDKTLHRDFISLVVEGADRAAWFFADVWRDDLYTNPAILQTRAISLLRGLRSGVGGNLNFPNEIKDAIKTKIAYPRIQKLAFDLKNNNYPIPKEKFEAIILNFIDNFLLESSSLMKQLRNIN